MLNIRPFLVINGVDSRSLPGLLISSLAPITKPLQRVQVEAIDGRDGDVITPLGFSAYDKPVKIGLTTGYNVDDIIQFFNTSGRVVFSNEPDKYYNFVVYNQIDFARLLRFKEATVTFHVQPFKYSDIENTKTFIFDDSTPKKLNIRNNGNYFSKPQINIKGTGNVYLYINGVQMLFIEFTPQVTNIIIDSAKMDAYSPDGSLQNRKVTGNYDNIKLNAGENEITFTGSVDEIQITNFSRWI